MLMVSQISIKNFKSCQLLEDVRLASFTPIVGYNNAGKSNILDAISWLFARYSLAEQDFFDPSQSVAVEAVIEGITDQSLSVLTDQHRARLEGRIRDGEIRIRREQATPGASVIGVKLTIWEWGSDDNEGGQWLPNPTGIDNAVSALFPKPIVISAMEDAGKDVAKSETRTTIGRLISPLLQAIEHSHGENISRSLEELRSLLEAQGANRASELSDFDGSVNECLQQYFPGISIKAHIHTPGLQDLFRGGTIKVYDDLIEGGLATDGKGVDSFGHGTQRALQMALLQYLSQLELGDTSRRVLLLIDEPELYMHPQAVAKIRSALKELSNDAFQVIFTTHSPIMISHEDARVSLCVFKDRAGGTNCRRRMEEALAGLHATARHQMELLFSFGNASEILFSDQVVLAEGKTEFAIIPDLVYLLKGGALSDFRIGFVPVHGSGNIRKCMQILDAMDIPTKAIVDLDYVFRQAVSSELLAEDDQDLARCRTICSSIAQDKGFQLGSHGFFEKSDKQIGFRELALNEEARSHLCTLINRLKDQDIWAWPRGTIEEYLGIDGKTENCRQVYRAKLSEEGLEALSDQSGVDDCINWIIPS